LLLLSVRACVVAGLLLQAAAVAPLRLGPSADQLTNLDVAEISKLVEGQGPAWVLIAQSQGFIPGRFVDVFLSPQVRTLSLRRGRMVSVQASPPTTGDVAGIWKRAGAEQPYAQVPLSRTDPDQVTNSRDLNRPFRIAGAFSDEEIVSLVAFIRSSPTVPGSPRPGGTLVLPNSEVQGQWPIGLLSHSGDDIRISLLDNDPRERSGQYVIVRRDGTTWIVQRITMWISD
jgi:hypothetical protein